MGASGQRGAGVGAYVLVVGDDLEQVELLRECLKSDEHVVQVVHDRRSTIDEVRCTRPDLLILDVETPTPDDLDLCRVLRRDFDVPVLLVAAGDRQPGDDPGADDRLAKPFEPEELLARARSLLGRAQPTTGRVTPLLRIGELVLDPLRQEVWVGARLVDCSPVEFRILATLVASPDRVFSRAELLEQAYGLDGAITERTIDVHVMNLRRKIEAAPRRPAYLRTVYGLGYKAADGS